MRLTLIHNPESGRAQPSRDALLALVRRAGWEVFYHPATDPAFLTALEHPGDAVLVAGGDGTVARVGRRLVGRDVPLAIVPLGTSNNIARSLGIRGSAREIIERLPTAVETTLDVGRARAAWGTACFIEAAGIGFFGSMLRRAEERRASGRAPRRTSPVAGALRGIRQALARYVPRHRHIVADGEDLSGPYLMAAAMNARSLGPRMELAPDADPRDRHLDLLLIRETERAVLAEYLSARAGGSATRFPIPTRRARHVRFGWDPDEGHLDDAVWPTRRSDEPEPTDIDEQTRRSSGAAMPAATTVPPSEGTLVDVEIVDPPLRVLVPSG